MKHIFLFMTFLSACMATAVQADDVVYSWESPSGTVQEQGGTVVQHNSLAVSRINYESSGYYTIQLCGKKEKLTAEDNSLDAVYFTISLADGKTFKTGDKIGITAMRNNDDGGKASIHFVYGNSSTGSVLATYDDTNTWANLGLMHEVTFSGGTGAKGTSVTGAGTEPLSEYALYPGTNTFTVPTEADGATTLTLTRNESECKLYLTKIAITRAGTTAIEQVEMATPAGTSANKENSVSYNLLGQKTSSNAYGIIIINGKKIIK